MFSSKSFGIESAVDAAGFTVGSFGAVIEEYKGSAIATYDMHGKPIAAWFKGKSLKPLAHIRFASAEARAKKIAEWKSNIDAWEAYKAKEKAAKAEARANFVNPLKVGDILVCSWGYDQTNIDFYKVLSVLPKSAKIQKCGSKFVEQNGPAGNRVVPDPDNLYGEVMFKKVGAGGCVRIASYASAYPWDGRSRYETDSMYGR